MKNLGFLICESSLFPGKNARVLIRRIGKTVLFITLRLIRTL